jgi:hypothetical protein
MGRFVNGLVALYTVALFNTERRHGKTILGSDFDLATVPTPTVGCLVALIAVICYSTRTTFRGRITPLP